MIKFCNKCREEKRKECSSGYSFWWRDDLSFCPYDQNELQNIDFEAKDLSIISEIAEEASFIEAMIRLKQDNIIEYESRMSQFRTQVQRQEFIKKAMSSHTPKCPTCGSSNIKPITSTERAASLIGLGIFSKKINKTYKCLNCKHTW